VLSAIEGLKAVAPGLTPWIVPITIAILVGLFMVQRHGTHSIGVVFGPVMVVWFLAIGALGLAQVVRAPGVLVALNPVTAIQFFRGSPSAAFGSLGAVILCIAGGEALYADMGHFGRRPIALAWYALVLPSLVLNYFGQGAFLLSGGAPDPSAFYAIVPHVLLWPMIALSAISTVIASQALISGAYSLTQQAVQLGLCPRVTVVHTSEGHSGQIYVPEVNRALMVACIALVAGFKSSDRLAAAYGLAVTGTMSVTTVAYFVVLARAWRWPMYRALRSASSSSDRRHVPRGKPAEVPRRAAGCPSRSVSGCSRCSRTWMAGRKRLAAHLKSVVLPLDMFLKDVVERKPPRVRGVAVFLTAKPRWRARAPSPSLQAQPGPFTRRCPSHDHERADTVRALG